MSDGWMIRLVFLSLRRHKFLLISGRDRGKMMDFGELSSGRFEDNKN